MLRLWVMLSILWIAAISAITITDTGFLEANKTFEIEGRFKEKYEVMAPSRTTESEAVAFAQSNIRNDCIDGKTGPWCNYPLKLEMPRKPINSLAIYLALGIPAGVFLIGGGFYWALSGFRRSA